MSLNRPIDFGTSKYPVQMTTIEIPKQARTSAIASIQRYSCSPIAVEQL
jgi:hypothetical protein